MLVIFLIVFIDLIGFGIIIPLLPFYGEHFSAAPFTVALLMAAFSLGQFIAAPFWGRVSDSIGRRPVLIISLLGSVLSYILLAFAGSLWVLFAARIIGGLMAGNISTAFAYIADITTPENRAKGMGLIGAAFGLGFIAGPAIGGILAGPDPLNADYTSPALAASIMSMVALVMTILLLKESLSDELKQKIRENPRKGMIADISFAISRPGVGTLILISFMATFAFAGMETIFAMWSRRQFGWGPEQNGYLFAFIGVIAALIQGGAVSRLARKFGESNLIIQGSLALIIGMVLIPFCTTPAQLVAVMFVVAYGFSVINPSLNSLISIRTADERQGAVMGGARAATTLARVLGPVWAGFFFAWFGKDWPYWSGAAIMLVVLVLAWRAAPENTAAKKSALENHKAR